MYYFIINPDSSRGRGGRVWKILKQRLDKTKVEYQAFLTQKQGDARRFAGELTEERREPVTIVAVGGDGTVNEIVDGLWLQCPVTLGYIPAGSGNDLARSLRLPKNPYKGLKNILEENPSCRMVDYGVISYGEGQLCCRRFMVSAGIGMDGAVCHSILNSRKDGKKLFKGRAADLQAGIKAMIPARPVKGYLLLDGVKKVEFNYLYFVSAHIHPFEGGGFLFAPDAVWDDGVLSLCVANHRKKRKLLRAAVCSFMGRRSGKGSGVRYYACREVMIHVDRPLAVHVDGENCSCQQEVHLRCIGRNLRMIV